MLKLLFDYSDAEMILEIMNSAPRHWALFIDISRIATMNELQDAIRFHEDSLLRGAVSNNDDLERRLKSLESRLLNRSSASFGRRKANAHVAEVNFVKKPIGSHPRFSQPKFSKADHVKTKKGLTPVQKGARPCRDRKSVV